MKKILLLDCDGTISHPCDRDLIAGMADKLKGYRDYIIIGITDQAGIAAGHKTLKDAILEQQITLDIFPEIASILFCPDFEGNKCFEVWSSTWEEKLNRPYLKGKYRQPGPGMLLEVIHSENADPADCLMVGDRNENQAAAIAANIAFVWTADF